MDEAVAPLDECYGFLGFGLTNNEAEYHGLLAVLQHASRTSHNRICVQLDSMLLVQQTRCQWACRSPSLKPLLAEAWQLIRRMEHGRAEVVIDHIYREHNVDADALANEAINSQTSVFWRPSP